MARFSVGNVEALGQAAMYTMTLNVLIHSCKQQFFKAIEVPLEARTYSEAIVDAYSYKDLVRVEEAATKPSRVALYLSAH